MAHTARLLSLATAVPKHRLDQMEVLERARLLFLSRGRDIERLLPVFHNAGIKSRYSCVPIAWYEGSAGWKERNALYLDHGVALLAEAARACLARAKVAPEQVDCLVTVSSSGIATPSLDARLLEEISFRRDVQRLPIFGLGCAGGVLGLARAAALAVAEPGALVLFLVVELCGLTFRSNDVSKSNVIATALFGDGAAAALVSCGTRGDNAAALTAWPALTAWGEYTWPDSLGVMGWRVEEDGFGVLFSRAIPTIVRERYGAAVDGFLAGQGLGRGDLAGTVCHPGGAKVLDAMEEVFDLEPGAMAESRAVLRDYGNMSAATVLFVLEHALRGAPGGTLEGRHLMSSLGPGFTAGFLLLESP